MDIIKNVIIELTKDSQKLYYSTACQRIFTPFKNSEPKIMVIPRIRPNKVKITKINGLFGADFSEGTITG